LLNRSFQAVTLLEEQKSGLFFELLVDRATGQVEEREAIDTLEAQAHAAKYGKLAPNLYERLQNLGEEEIVPVAVWIVAPPGQRLDELEVAARTTLAGKYAEAHAAVEHGDSPHAVDSPELARQIEQEYRSMITNSMNQRVQPLAMEMEAQGVSVKADTGLPALFISLSKKAILTLATRSDVGEIDLMEGRGTNDLDSAIQTNRATAVHRRGGRGFGVRVAMIEAGNVDFDQDNNNASNSLCPPGTNNCFPSPGQIDEGFGEPFDDIHATLTASAVGSWHVTYPGMAPGATIISAGVGSETQAAINTALQRSLNVHDADLVNVSYSFCASNADLTPVDKTFDHWARQSQRLIVVSSGNRIANVCDTDYVNSPGKAWNVLSVGAYDDRGDANWANDLMATQFSKWKDSSTNDRDKPEVVAPGVLISGVGPNGKLALDNTNTPFSGTSFSTPQVTGLAALLLHGNIELRSAPPALKAIIMATASHNLDGVTGIPVNQDLLDGAGGINADLADRVSEGRGANPPTTTNRCIEQCWWGGAVRKSDFPGGKRSYYFEANAGDRIRVAIAWYSNADCKFTDSVSCKFDRLDTNLNLKVYGPGDVLLPGGASASTSNNYELVPPNGVLDGGIPLPKTGMYRIEVINQSFNEETNYLGVAWTKLPEPVPAVTSWSANRLDMIVRGNDGGLWHRYWDGTYWYGGWSEWESLGGYNIVSDPSAVSWGPGRIDVFVKEGPRLKHLYYDLNAGIPWTWEDMGDWSGAKHVPAVTSWGPGRLDLISWHNTLISHKYFDSSAGGWSRDWPVIGSCVTRIDSQPAAVSWGAGRIDVFAQDISDRLIHVYYDRNAGGWNTNCENLGNSLASAPTVTSWGPNRLDVFWRGTDQKLKHKFLNGTGTNAWSDVETFDGVLTSGPGAVSWGVNRIDVFVQSSKYILYQKSLDGVGPGAWSGWINEGSYP
jgi:hypothetical protein